MPFLNGCRAECQACNDRSGADAAVRVRLIRQGCADDADSMLLAVASVRCAIPRMAESRSCNAFLRSRRPSNQDEHEVVSGGVPV